MIVRIVNGQISIEQSDDLTRLNVISNLKGAEPVDRALTAAGLGRVAPNRDDVPSEALLDVDELRRRAVVVSTVGDWDRLWDNMIIAAQRAGWIVDDGASVRAHIE